MSVQVALPATGPPPLSRNPPPLPPGPELGAEEEECHVEGILVVFVSAVPGEEN